MDNMDEAVQLFQQSWTTWTTAETGCRNVNYEEDYEETYPVYKDLPNVDKRDLFTSATLIRFNTILN
jgi:hypothetical protein